MKGTIALALAGFVPSALGCLQLHADLTTEPFMDDVTQTKIFEGGDSKFFSDNEDGFVAKCGDYEANFWDNGCQSEV